MLGELTGSGTLKPGDFVINELGRFEIEAIEAFRELLDRVEPPRNIGLCLGTAVDRGVFAKGQQIRFERYPDARRRPLTAGAATGEAEAIGPGSE